MKVSVVVPAYNEEGIIGRCLKSLRSQTVPCEIVVCDNNSTDDTYEISRRYADKVVKEKRQGVAYAFNAAIRASDGELIALTGADCIVPPTWIESFLKEFRDKKVIACYGPVVTLEKTHRRTFKAYNLFNKVLVKLKLSWGVSDANMMIRRDVIERVGLFDPRVQMLEDSWLLKKIRKYGRITFINHNVVKTSVRRLEKSGIVKVFAERAIAMLKLKIFHRLGDEHFEPIR